MLAARSALRKRVQPRGRRRPQHGRAGAARLAKKDRKDFYDVIRRTGVDPQEFR